MKKFLNFFSEKIDKEPRFRDRIYGLVLYTVLIGGLIPFAAQFLIPTIGSLLDKNINVPGAEVWNQYASIILGIVATILSVVSMYLGFKNSDESAESERRTRDLISKLDEETKEILEKQRRMIDLQQESLEEQKEMHKNIRDNMSSTDPKNKNASSWKNTANDGEITNQKEPVNQEDSQ